MATAMQKKEANEVALSNGDPQSLIRLAIEEKVPVEVLERLMDLADRVSDRNARAAFFSAVSSLQEEVTEIRKSSKADIRTKSGAKFGYTYAPLDEITRSIRPAMKRHGLSYSWTAELEGKVLKVICVLRHVDGHEERASFPVPIDTDAAMSEAQKNGAALTYGKRQSLTSVLGLTTADEDTDAPQARPGSVEPITEGQVMDLEALMDEVGADRNKFLDFFHLGMLEQITQADYPRAVAMLERKRKVAV